MIKKEEMIKSIYEKVAEDKDIIDRGCEYCKSFNFIFLPGNLDYCYECKDCGEKFNNPSEIESKGKKSVMIGDVLDYIADNNISKNKEDISNYQKKLYSILDYWIIGKKPIEEQSDDTIKYIYNLIK